MSRPLHSPPLELLLAASDELLLLVDPVDQNIAAANPRAAELLGVPLEAMVGRPITEFECALQDVFYWSSVAAGHLDEVRNVEGLYARGDGGTLEVEKSIWPVRADGRDWLLIRARDIGARMAVENELAQTTSLLRATLESTAEGILVVDLDGRIVNFNHRFAELWRIPAEVLEQGEDQAVFRWILGRLLHPLGVIRRWRRLVAGRDDETFDTLTLSDGRSVECRSRPQVMKDQMLGRVFSLTDVTERIRHERELAAARDAALAASRAKSEFLSQMSHELRTPLNAILGFAQILADEVDEAAKEPVDAISRAGWHLLDLINELLDMAKIEAGRLQVEMESVDLAELCRDCVMLVQPLADRHGVRLAGLPADQTAWVRADRLRLKQMLLNLLSNAIKYNREDGEARLELTRVEHYARLTVIDTGIGIGSEEQAELFQPFSRVGKKQKLVEGTGIGLAFTRKLAELMGGNVGFASTPEVGSRFWIDLQETTAPSLPATSLGSEAIARPIIASRRHVLYIEDDKLSRVLMQRIFAKYPEVDFSTAENGAEGLEKVRTQRPSLVLCDMNLGDMLGLDVLKTIRGDPELRFTPVFALSANAMADDIAAGLAAGFDQYLTKPVRVPELLAAVWPVLAGG